MDNNNRSPKQFYYIADLTQDFNARIKSLRDLNPDAEAERAIWSIQAQLASAQQLAMISAALSRIADAQEVITDALKNETKATVKGR